MKNSSRTRNFFSLLDEHFAKVTACSSYRLSSSRLNSFICNLQNAHNSYCTQKPVWCAKPRHKNLRPPRLRPPTWHSAPPKKSSGLPDKTAKLIWLTMCVMVLSLFMVSVYFAMAQTVSLDKDTCDIFRVNHNTVYDANFSDSDKCGLRTRIEGLFEIETEIFHISSRRSHVNYFNSVCSKAHVSDKTEMKDKLDPERTRLDYFTVSDYYSPARSASRKLLSLETDPEASDSSSELCPTEQPHSEPSEFRRRRSAEKETIAALFELYYQCLENKNKAYVVRSEPIVAMLLQYGQSTTLECPLCLRPDEEGISESETVQWHRSLQYAIGEEPVPVDGDKFSIGQNYKLLINQISPDDTGKYICKWRHHVEATYQVDVVEHEATVQVMETNSRGRQPQNDTQLPVRNLMVFTDWAPWGPCDQCNQTGHRRRLGLCRVKKLDLSEPVMPDDIPRLTRYVSGLPCRSPSLPTWISQLPQIHDRKSEVMVGKCWEPCPTVQPIREITDAAGNVIEVVETGKGFLSMHDPLPSLPPLVKRDTMYRSVGTKAVLTCKGANVESAILWHNQTTVLDPIKLKRRSRGRIEIDFLNRLVIKRLRMNDTGFFTCWTNGHHIATIKVVVTETQTSLNVNDYMAYIGLAICLLAMLLIIIRVVKAQTKYRHNLK